MGRRFAGADRSKKASPSELAKHAKKSASTVLRLITKKPDDVSDDTRTDEDVRADARDMVVNQITDAAVAKLPVVGDAARTSSVKDGVRLWQTIADAEFELQQIKQQSKQQSGESKMPPIREEEDSDHLKSLERTADDLSNNASEDAVVAFAVAARAALPTAASLTMWVACVPRVSAKRTSLGGLAKTINEVTLESANHLSRIAAIARDDITQPGAVEESDRIMRCTWNWLRVCGISSPESAHGGDRAWMMFRVLRVVSGL